MYYYSGGIPLLINNFGDLAVIFSFAADKKKINWKIVVDVVPKRTTGAIKCFEGKVCLTPNIIERAAEAEKLRRALVEETDVDIFRDL